ncbi:alkaline shock response membrane anchor protein AmaP [Enterococcus sp. ALS3]|uniref:Alkaline shock response membrane anchor protein AmaP n=1 Tax=Enterococcus alishanensis TaxID=1303817 RepID=A0ABS6THJ9_9ENTE|nr:alkaline shock response membrane anchor protein AmaP [Enterococcus alishanensis]MBV7392405.1 alkaline shock response membrane anchor protein AmaP [Enterococcus alishanensis]
MKKKSKFFLFLLALSAVFPLFFTLVSSQKAVKLPFHLIDVREYPFFDNFLIIILFWLSLVWLVILLIALIVIIFFPSYRKQMKIKSESGALTIQKKAIDNFILCILKDEKFVANPSVTTIFKAKKIKIKIKGDIRGSDTNIIEKKKYLSTEIETKIKDLFGINERIQTVVTFKNYEKSKKNQQTKRVN